MFIRTGLCNISEVWGGINWELGTDIYTLAKSFQSCPTLCDTIDGSPPGSPIPGIFPGKNTGVGCHFLLQCMKVKSESEVAKSCLTLSDPMDCSSPGSPSMGFSRQEYWSGLPFSSPGNLPNPGIKLGSPSLQADALASEPWCNQKKKA